jgi:hypothetical protein
MTPCATSPLLAGGVALSEYLGFITKSWTSKQSGVGGDTFCALASSMASISCGETGEPIEIKHPAPNPVGQSPQRGYVEAAGH